MKKRLWLAISALLTLAVCKVILAANTNDEKQLHRALDEVISGLAFQSNDIQLLQQDDFANPGLLWRDEGERLFGLSSNATSSCHSCHSAASLVGAARTFPKYNAVADTVINLEQQINLCRSKQQKQAPLEYESEALLSLTTYVASLSSGMAFNVDITGPAAPYFEQGRAYYYTRVGQLNLACKHCHEDNYGQRLRGDTLSQGHSNNYPTYRLEWQNLGSLHRRLRFCNTGVRAQPFPFGAQQYVNLELFLAWRAAQLPLEVPSVRR